MLAKGLHDITLYNLFNKFSIKYTPIQYPLSILLTHTYFIFIIFLKKLYNATGSSDIHVQF
jgi:hypothetical protein